jgi:digeranylgeranylglycerophospholipid reductase
MADITIPDPKKIHLYFGNKIAPRGYVWIFPKGKDVANVGIGIIGKGEKAAKDYLLEFINSREELKRGSILEVNAGGIPVGGLLKKMTLDNFLAIGDAAHQVNPIHGGGMFEAQFAAKIAAEVIDEALQKNDTSEKQLDKYNKEWWKQRGNYLRKVEKLREVVEKFSDDDFNFLAEELKGDLLVDFTRGKGLRVFAKILLKKPHLAKLAKALF